MFYLVQIFVLFWRQKGFKIDLVVAEFGSRLCQIII